MADFILHMPPRFFARVFGNPAGDPVLLKSRGVTLLRDKNTISCETNIHYSGRKNQFRSILLQDRVLVN